MNQKLTFFYIVLYCVLFNYASAQSLRDDGGLRKFNIYMDDSRPPCVQYGITGGSIIHSMWPLKFKSHVSLLNTQILSEDYFKNYHLDQGVKNGKHLGGFVNIIFNKYAPFSIYLEGVSSDQEMDLSFDNYEKDFGYRMRFKYMYLNFSGVVRYYPALGASNPVVRGFYAGAGYIVGFNTADDIEYIQRGKGYLPAFGTDDEQSQQLRNVLTPRNDKGPVFELGYKIPYFPAEICLRYHWGHADLVHVEPNSYNFIEKPNEVKLLQASLRIDIAPFFRN